jgi:predicted PurR-regulated permease PerM
MNETGLRPKPGEELTANGRGLSTVLWLIAVLATLYTVYFTRELLLPIVAAYFLKLALFPIVRGLRRWGIPESLGALAVLAVVVGTIAFGAYLLTDPANEWLARAPSILRRAASELRSWRGPVENISRAAEEVEAMTNLDARGAEAPAVEVRGPSLTNLLFQSTGNFLATVTATVVLLYLLLAAGDLFLRKVITILPRIEDKVAAVELSRELERTISHYLLTVTAINFGLGVAVGFCMHWLGMPNAVLWGLMVALFNFVPYVGAIASAAVLFFAAFVTFQEVPWSLVVVGVFVALNTLENSFITPTILGRRMSMNPVAIFIAMIFFGWAWGIYGIVLAVPILAAAKLLCERTASLQPLAELIGD